MKIRCSCGLEMVWEALTDRFKCSNCGNMITRFALEQILDASRSSSIILPGGIMITRDSDEIS